MSRRPFWVCVKESGQWRVGRILIRTPVHPGSIKLKARPYPDVAQPGF